MSNHSQYLTAVAAAAGALGGAYCAYRCYQELARTKIPQEWTRVGSLQNLYIFPIKSCGSVVVTSAEVAVPGLRVGWLRDRYLMVVDQKNNFVTARAFPDMLLVEPSMNSVVLTLKHPSLEPVHINLAEVAAYQPTKTARVWGASVPVYDCGYEASEWFSRLLDKSPNNYRLVYYSSEHCRPYNSLNIRANKFYTMTKKDTGVFTDEVSFHLINEASVDELNTRLKKKLTHQSFRPNFVVAGAKAYDEDNWKFVRIGDNVFEVIKPCTRCTVTTLDPETGVRDANSEPVETLKTYRQLKNPVERRATGDSPCMGLNLALRSGPGGLISVDDPVYVAY